MQRAPACKPVRTGHGTVPACREVERWTDGLPRRCTPAATCRLMTQAGVLAPRFAPEEPRHPRVSPIDFHDNGQVARIALDQPARVPTPLGPLPAELLLFHPDGSLKRLFPTNGKLSEFWTLEDEQRLVPRLKILTPLGEIEARFISVAFHATGGLRTVTLWPSDQVALPTPVGIVRVRQGLSFRADGSLESLEPARPLAVETPLGPLHAFDPQPIGLNADANSLQFGSGGEVTGLTTISDTLVVTLHDGTRRRFVPEVGADDCSDACATGDALKLQFGEDKLTLRLGPRRATYPVASVAVERRDDGRRHLPCLQ